jgi:tetratricopeptide (TPR) repeat protein
VIVGDHGESFGEHGEQEHGYLLHQPTLAVPLIVSGPGLTKAGQVRSVPVAIGRLAATLAEFGGVAAGRLPGRPLELERDGAEETIYHETEFPASTFGWSPLAAVTRGRWRLVDGPKPALYDLVADPGEATNRLATEAERARELRRDLRRLEERRARKPDPVERDEELSAALAGLGYLSGATARRGTLDPAEGVLLLADYAAAKQQLARGEVAAGRATLDRLIAKSPSSAPFLTQRARAERMAGDFAASRASLAAALSLNPQNEFVWAMVGDLERDAGRPEASEAALRKAVELNPRFASAWVSLGELLTRSGRPAEEEAALRAAVASDAESGVVYARLAEIELGRGDVTAADAHARRATELLPGWAPAWGLWARVATRQGRADLASEREARAAALR